jgi:hypothetical protein
VAVARFGGAPAASEATVGRWREFETGSEHGRPGCTGGFIASCAAFNLETRSFRDFFSDISLYLQCTGWSCLLYSCTANQK